MTKNPSSVAENPTTIGEQVISTHSNNISSSALTQANIVLNSFKISKKASNRSWYKTSSTNVVMNTNQEVTIKKESLLVPAVNHHHKLEETSQKSTGKRIVPKKKKCLNKVSHKESNPHLQAVVFSKG